MVDGWTLKEDNVLLTADGHSYSFANSVRYIDCMFTCDWVYAASAHDGCGNDALNECRA